MLYLQDNWRGQHRLWTVINTIVAEGLPECRWQTREYTKEVLGSVMELIHQKRILRFRKKWITTLDLPQQIIPLEQIPPDRLRKI